MEEIEVNQMSPLVWAYIGDSVYEQYVRNYLVTSTKYKPHKLHIEATKFVKASAQANILMQLEEKLTEEELVDIKVRLENLLMECEEILQNYDEENS